MRVSYWHGVGKISICEVFDDWGIWATVTRVAGDDLPYGMKEYPVLWNRLNVIG